jgi:exodeoxyribonuclease V alpha subunit
VREDPYQLARDVSGIGFRRADDIARALGVAADSEQRLDAVLEHVLAEAAEEGHCYLPRPQVIERCGAYMADDAAPARADSPSAAIAAAIERQARARRVVVEADVGDQPVYLERLHRHETGCARRIRDLQAAPAAPIHPDPEAALERYEAGAGIRLSATQRAAVLAALTHKVLVVTGGPGTGKTTLVRGIVRLAELRRRRVVLGAPTGRAAKRLAEATRSEAATLHRLLEWTPQTGRFQRDRANPLVGDVFIVDEVSMLDVPLLHALLRALPDAARLVCVGDADQLPPIGPGAALTDLITSDCVKTIRLTEIFRQHDGSGIVESAHRIRTGKPPELPPPGVRADFVLVQRDEPAALLETLCELVVRRLPASLGIAPGRDLQVLVPMHRGAIGVEAVNRELQRVLNPNGEPIPGTPLRVGDKVMQVRNNYALEVYNGDVGSIEAVDTAARKVLVRLDDRMLRYELAEIDQLILAYACTVHKSQGSEYPAVVVVLHAQHHIMLQRNLLYTAVTRAKRQVVLLGQERALMTALRDDSRQKRFTRLAQRLAAP